MSVFAEAQSSISPRSQPSSYSITCAAKVISAFDRLDLPGLVRPTLVSSLRLTAIDQSAPNLSRKRPPAIGFLASSRRCALGQAPEL